jgi:hypothetical protein
MDFETEQQPRLQIDDDEPLPIGSARVQHELDHAYLRDIVGVDGQPVALPVGSKVTLYTGHSMVFVGVVQEDHSVLDMLSCEEDDGEYVDI